MRNTFYSILFTLSSITFVREIWRLLKDFKISWDFKSDFKISREVYEISGVMDLFTDSDTIMKGTLHIPACIAAINHLLNSGVINIKDNI